MDTLREIALGAACNAYRDITNMHLNACKRRRATIKQAEVDVDRYTVVLAQSCIEQDLELRVLAEDNLKLAKIALLDAHAQYTAEVTVLEKLRQYSRMLLTRLMLRQDD